MPDVPTAAATGAPLATNGAVAPPAAVPPVVRPGTKPPEAPPPAPTRLKIRDGRGEVMELEEGEAAALIRRGREHHKNVTSFEQKARAKEAALAEREARLNELAENPAKLKAFLKSIGKDPRALGEELVLEGMEEEKLTPAEKALRAKEAALAERETKIKEEEEGRQGEAYKVEVQRHQERFAKLFTEGLSAAGVPDGAARLFLPHMAALYQAVAAAEAAGEPPIDVRYVAEHLRDVRQTMLSQHVAALSIEDLEGLIGEREIDVERGGQKVKQKLPYPEIVNRRYLERLRAKRSGSSGAVPPPTTAPSGINGVDPASWRDAPAEVQRAGWDLVRAHPEERASKEATFRRALEKYKTVK